MWIRILEVSQWTAGKATGRLVGLALLLALAPFGPMACVSLGRQPVPTSCVKEEIFPPYQINVTASGLEPPCAHISVGAAKVTFINKSCKDAISIVLTPSIIGSSPITLPHIMPGQPDERFLGSDSYKITVEGCTPDTGDKSMTGTLEVGTGP
jgi:hypothetical protein